MARAQKPAAGLGGPPLPPGLTHVFRAPTQTPVSGLPIVQPRQTNAPTPPIAAPAVPPGATSRTPTLARPTTRSQAGRPQTVAATESSATACRGAVSCPEERELGPLAQRDLLLRPLRVASRASDTVACPPAPWEHVFVMTSQGSAGTRFRRALAAGDPLIARAALAELPRIHVADALAVTLLHRDREPERFAAMAVRLHALLCREARLSMEEAQLALAALGSLAGAAAESGAQALVALLDAHELDAARDVIDAWLDRAGAGRGALDRSRGRPISGT